MPYKFLDLVRADVAFEVTAGKLEELFKDAGIAVAATQIKNFKSIKPVVQKKISLRSDKVDELLFKFLEELIFIKDTENIILTKFTIKISKKGLIFVFECMAAGEKLDPKKQEQLVDVKAVTMHLFEVKQQGKSWQARVVLDV